MPDTTPNLTPNEIINKEFRKGMRGYVTEEVDDYLQQVSETMYAVLQENQRLKGQVESLREQLQRYQETEGMIKNTLMLAERTADEVRQHAQHEADLLRREAEEQLRCERTQLAELRQRRDRATAELRALLQAHLEMLDASERRSRGSQEGMDG